MSFQKLLQWQFYFIALLNEIKLETNGLIILEMKEEIMFVNAGIICRHFSVQRAIRLSGVFTYDV